MKTEEEIKKQIEIYKKIIEKNPLFTQGFTLASGAKIALEWVLEIEDVTN